MSAAEHQAVSMAIDDDLREEIAAECRMLRGGPVTEAAIDDLDARRDGGADSGLRYFSARHATHGRAAERADRPVNTRASSRRDSDPLAPRGSRPCRHCLEERAHGPGPCPHCGRD